MVISVKMERLHHLLIKLAMILVPWVILELYVKNVIFMQTIGVNLTQALDNLLAHHAG
jgi:hypothetical protein